MTTLYLANPASKYVWTFVQRVWTFVHDVWIFASEHKSPQCFVWWVAARCSNFAVTFGYCAFSSKQIKRYETL